jgi:hypothetical protein
LNREYFRLSAVLHTCNLSTQEVKGGRSQVPGQPRLGIKTLSQKEKRKNRIISDKLYKMLMTVEVRL